MDIPITIIAGTLPSGAVYNPQTYFNAIVARMTASVSGGNIIFGQLGGGQPSGPLPGNGAQAGLWFGDPDGGQGYWNDWNADAASYLPARMVCGQYIGGSLVTTEFLCGAIDADTTIETPNKSGTLALQSDLTQALGTQSYSGLSSLTIDWSSRVSVYVIMGGNMTINATNTQDGLVMDFWLENRTGAGTFTITMPNVIWTGTDPVLSTGIAGTRVIDHVRVYRSGGILFGQVVNTGYHLVGDTSSLVPVSATGSANQIVITMSGVLAGGSLLAADFTVLINGTSAAVTSAIYSGTLVAVNIGTSMPNNATVTVAYTGSDMKALGGNTVAHFGPLTVDLSGGGGIHNHAMPGGHGAPP